MRMPRALAVFLCAAGAALALGFTKALLISGLDTLPPWRVLTFASCTFGLIAALLDWGLLRDLLPSAKTEPVPVTKTAAVSTPPEPQAPRPDPIIDRARRHTIVFRELCPPPAPPGLSFYGGAPIGPATLAWPRLQHKPGNAPLSFVMQWDLAELSQQDPTGLLPRDGVLYLFSDLTWGDPFDFQFVHAPGPVQGWQALPVPKDLPPIYGDEGAYAVPYCSSQIAKQGQSTGNSDVPRLMPKWPFTPQSLPYPAPPRDPGTDAENDGAYWNEGKEIGEALLLLSHPDGVPPPKRLDNQPLPFARPFAGFPHDYAAVRVIAAKALDKLRHPQGILRTVSEEERQAKFEAWKMEATQRYALATTHPPQTRIGQSQSDELWHWMATLEPVLALGWGSLVEECVNVSLGLESEAVDLLPADLVAKCTERHRLASAYLHDEYPDHGKPGALAEFEARKAAGTLKEVRSLHAPCPNHMFGPPSYVQGYVEEYLNDWVLLLELSSRKPIGHEFGEGVLQFLIQPSDLRAGRFDRAKLIASAY